MRLTSEELRGIYQQETVRPSRQRDECLSADEMMRAAEGRMNQAERERVADHLMSCADCVEEYRLVRSLKPWAATVAAAVDDPQPQYEPESDAPRFGWRERLVAFFSPVGVSYAMAAALLVVSVALGVWTVSLYREKRQLAASYNQQLAERDRRLAEMEDALAKERPLLDVAPGQQGPDETQIAELRQKVESLSAMVDELSRPQLNVPITDLSPGDSSRGEPAKDVPAVEVRIPLLQGRSFTARGEPAKDVPAVEVPAGANFFTLILNLPNRPTYPNYEVDVLNQQGVRIWLGQGLQRSEADTFTIALARRFFPAGQYRIKLYGLRDGRRELIEDYAVRVQYH